MSGADLTDPAVIDGFRQHLAGFLRDGHSALSGAVNQYLQVEERLRGELQAHWKVQLRRREEVYSTARLAYLAAKTEVDANQRGRGGGKQSCDEERMEMDKARRRMNEAEEKLAMIQRWLLRLRQDGDPLVSRCRSHDLALEDLGARAMRSLESMSRSIDGYHRTVVPPASSGPVPGEPPHV